MKSITRAITAAVFGFAVCMTAEESFGQGFIFNNTGGNGGSRARVFGPELDNPYEQKWGNTADASPPGSQMYSGAPLVGTNYRVEAWYSLTPVQNAFALVGGAAPVQGSQTFFPDSVLPGHFSRGDQYIPDGLPSPPGSSYPYTVYLQIRSWDNRNGQYASWDEAWNAAQTGSGNAVGWSKTFEQPLAIGLQPYPGMMNFESFNLFIVPIPEPSLTVLAVLGGAVLFASARIRRRHRHRR